MRHLGSKILDLLKTIYFNFRVFPFKTAIKLPVLISRHIKTKNLHKGSIEINSDISRFMIKIGIGGSEGQIGNKQGFWLIQKGSKIIFNGSAGFSRGNSIRIDSGYMEIGNNFNSNSFSLYHCVNHILTAEINVIAFTLLVGGLPQGVFIWFCQNIISNSLVT